MQIGLYSAAAGMYAQQTWIDAIANDMATFRSTGFGRVSVERVEQQPQGGHEHRHPARPRRAVAQHPVGDQAASLVGAVHIGPARQRSVGGSQPYGIALGECPLGLGHDSADLQTTLVHRPVLGCVAMELRPYAPARQRWLQLDAVNGAHA